MASAAADLLAAARGDIPCDLVLRNARLINVFSGEIEPTDIAIHGDRIAGVGAGYAARETIDLKNAFVAPGLIDGHVHIESSLCLPGEFAAAVVPRGVTTAVTDPHEIANVAGAAGVRFMADAAKGLPLRVVTMAPSCVPATDMATTGAALTAGDLEKLLDDGVVHGLAEVMNFPGVIAGDAGVLSKLQAFENRPVDGHAPGVNERPLNAYIAAGIGSDHECTTVEEAREKLARGQYVLIRNATAARNLDALLPLVTPANSRRICFCTDDRTPPDLLDAGSIDYMVRRAIEFGIDPVIAFQMATLNPADWFGLHDRGAIAPGRFADLMIFDDLRAPQAKAVYSGGALVARDGSLTQPPPQPTVPEPLCRTMNMPAYRRPANVPAKPGRIRMIGLRPDQLITDHLLLDPLVRDGNAVADPARDVLKIMVTDRYGGEARVGVGFIRGFGLKRGAIAGSVAHDHHNIIAIGCSDDAITTAAGKVDFWGGGLCVVDEERFLLAALTLPVAGLMSDQPIGQVRADYDSLLAAARELGCPLRDPFMAMSFMALEVIPSLKLTDQGLVDVDAFRHVDLFV